MWLFCLPDTLLTRFLCLDRSFPPPQHCGNSHPASNNIVEVVGRLFATVQFRSYQRTTTAPIAAMSADSRAIFLPSGLYAAIDTASLGFLQE